MAMAIHCIVETGHALSLRKTDINEFEEKTKHSRYRNQGKNTISSMVGSFKSAVTKYCNQNKLAFGWQARFDDDIIRNLHEFYMLRSYILNNAANRKDDRFYSA